MKLTDHFTPDQILLNLEVSDKWELLDRMVENLVASPICQARPERIRKEIGLTINVTTVILISPITILICQVLEMQVIPVLILEAVFSNIGGTATLIGDPPNILIGSRAGLSFNEFLVNLTPAVLLIMVVTVVVVFFLFGKGALIGASANVVICQIARKNRYPITFWQFTKLGFPMMILSLVISTAYIYVVYFLR